MLLLLLLLPLLLPYYYYHYYYYCITPLAGVETTYIFCFFLSVSLSLPTLVYILLNLIIDDVLHFFWASVPLCLCLYVTESANCLEAHTL